MKRADRPRTTPRVRVFTCCKCGRREEYIRSLGRLRTHCRDCAKNTWRRRLATGRGGGLECECGNPKLRWAHACSRCKELERIGYHNEDKPCLVTRGTDYGEDVPAPRVKMCVRCRLRPAIIGRQRYCSEKCSHNMRSAIYWTRISQERRDQGLCVKCGKESAAAPYVTCETCRIRAQCTQRKRRPRKRTPSLA